MKTLSLLDFCHKLKALKYLKADLPPRLYDKDVLDKKDFIGKRFESLLALYPDTHVKTTFTTQPDSVYAEVRKEQGTLLLVFEHLICVQVEYFPDKGRAL